MRMGLTRRLPKQMAQGSARNLGLRSDAHRYEMQTTGVRGIETIKPLSYAVNTSL